MAYFRPRVSREAEVRYHADREIAKNVPDLLRKAVEAERRLVDLRTSGAPLEQVREAALEYDRALADALRAAEAAQRAAAGVKAYDSRIARRKAKSTPEGAFWAAEVHRLRTLREAHRLNGIPRVPRHVPSAR
ncbi:hypothetical protein TBS_07100 [Thermobispora bispora]|uniref:Uncharacterized protein n=1 Tax=Thermobispora bispora (strain ATCC 19993 / DSM 43833 / CBS 139.67 / JCM 10125 / KCTC 9307 / NBRC 14880 / R51) TaxID=469371 RepID=D6YB56_THEBD|nr:hypothetical protein [Thermobispora bispora]ADG88416.1 hypothetical protein Tbis_1703 [Thermobispora bispora DSM 43833]MBO2475263.1 hypothetical protein [Actinomycetales bacterium]MDI9580312.1 hypothetical protein [Thermobispora sp.]QSI48232.1 hypothetical protein CYL17_10535 [Thermobispora bispora]